MELLSKGTKAGGSGATEIAGNEVEGTVRNGAFGTEVLFGTNKDDGFKEELVNALLFLFKVSTVWFD